jgi:perosamine synthetase
MGDFAMIGKAERDRILRDGRTRIAWEGEPMLGATYGEEEVEAAVSAIRDSMTISRGFGFSCETIQAFEKAFADYAGVKHGIAVNSAGPGLDMMMRYLDLQPGDEVIVPAINFMAAPLSVVGAGGQIVWGEVNPETLQLDPEDVEKRITPRTRAIYPVHMNGCAAPLDDFYELAERYPHEKHGPLAVIGDAARACGGRYKGEPLGRKGLATVFLLHTMKNICTLGEGGMITTDDDDVAAFCRATRFYGAAQGVWGTSNVMTKVQAAVGLAQLEKLDNFIENRRRIAHLRNHLLEGAPHITLPVEPEDCYHTYYLYTCLADQGWAGEKRDAIIRMMDEKYNVKCLVANPPAYESHRLLREHTAGQQLPLSEALGRRILCVPIHPAMSEEDNEIICAALLSCIETLE